WSGIRSERRVLYDVPHFRDHTVRVHIDDFHAVSRDSYFTSLYGSRRRRCAILERGAGKCAARQEHSGGYSRDGLQEISAISHALPHFSSPMTAESCRVPPTGSTKK